VLAALLEGPKHGWALKKLAGFVYGPAGMHNNLLYPLLRKFAAEGWVRRREEAGERGQTRAVYSLTSRGAGELMRRLRQFSEKGASSASEFLIRVGLFGLLDLPARRQILSERDKWLEKKEKHFVLIHEGVKAMEKSEWGAEVSCFLLRAVRAERKWIRSLERTVAQVAETRVSRRRQS
jgi:DNA-binding PadR family transcriptional regulator